jgi:hypothetical protein
MQIIPAKQVARIMGKNLNWIYANARQLGGLKIGGSWIFTQANLEHALNPQTPTAASETLQNRKPAPRRGRPRARRPAPGNSPANVEPELEGLARELGLEWMVE